MTSKLERDAQALRSQLDADVEQYLALGDKLNGLRRAQKELREKKILPVVEKLGLQVGELFEGEASTLSTNPLVRLWREFKRFVIAEDIGFDEGSDAIIELEEVISELEPYEDETERKWSLTKFPGAKRLNVNEFKRHLVEAGVKPATVKQAEAKATKPGAPTIKIQWRASERDEDGDGEE